MAQNYADLSRDELLQIITKQQKQIEALTNPPPNDWHSWFYSLLMIKLGDIPSVRIDREVVLGAQPPRADFVVISDDAAADLGLSVFKGYKKYNIIEFKSPGDELSESVLWKIVSYMAAYISKFGVDPDAITLTTFRDTKPTKMLSNPNIKVESTEIEGLYKITEWRGRIPVSVIVTSELVGKEYAGFRGISKHPQVADIEQMLDEMKNEKSERRRGWYRDYLELFSKLDSDTLEEAKRRNPDMAKTWREVFEFDKELKEREKETKLLDIKNVMKNLQLNIEQAMDALSIPPEQRFMYANLVKGAN